MLRKEENYMVGSTRKSDVIIKPKIEVLRLEMGGGGGRKAGGANSRKPKNDQFPQTGRGPPET